MTGRSRAIVRTVTSNGRAVRSPAPVAGRWRPGAAADVRLWLVAASEAPISALGCHRARTHDDQPLPSARQRPSDMYAEQLLACRRRPTDGTHVINLDRDDITETPLA
jgi:hypothetical protein